jgi:tRNA pseudouridine32 synthase / 23S rRNA pseudouridine746 synthase
MRISKQPSKLSLPQINPGVISVLDYLLIKFPNIKPQVWQQRIADGKVHWHDGSLITKNSSFKAQQRVYYYREVENEPTIPFAEEIIFQNDEILVAYKPHFLPVTPGGIYINECLQNRLRDKTGLEYLQAVHRLDRATAGLVLFSVNPATRHRYHDLFETRQIEKTYQAISQISPTKNLPEQIVGQKWEIKNRIVKSDPRFLMKTVEGEENSYSIIHCLKQSENQALFKLKPITGKTHQLRLHMQACGWPILHDKYYPTLQEESTDDYSKPLQLLAKELRFTDPITQNARVFISNKNLNLQ